MKIYFLLLILILNYFYGYSQSDSTNINVKDSVFVHRELSPVEKTDSIINKFKSDPVLKNSKWGFAVYNPKTKNIVISKDENDSFIPASTTKLITTETALNLVGENFRWKTQLDYSGEIDSLGILNGNLYIVGNNDPTLGYSRIGALTKTQFFNDLYYTLQNNGIKQIKGNIIAESVVFKTDFPLPKDLYKIDQGEYYSIPNEIIEKNQLIIEQSNPDNYFINNNKSVINNILKTKTRQESSINLPNAPVSLAKELKNHLIYNKKLKIIGDIIAQDYSTINSITPRKKIYTLESPTLKDVVYFVNQTSNNLFAENLLKLVGYYVGKKTNKQEAIDQVMNHLINDKFDTSLLNYADGSGLSRDNYVTPISQVKYLANIMKKPYYNTFYESLPKSGYSGTLKNMFVDSVAKGRIHAKTGTLSNVKALSGYVDTNSGERLCFSLLINNFNPSQIALVKKKMQVLLESVVNY